MNSRVKPLTRWWRHSKSSRCNSRSSPGSLSNNTRTPLESRSSSLPSVASSNQQEQTQCSSPDWSSQISSRCQRATSSKVWNLVNQHIKQILVRANFQQTQLQFRMLLQRSSIRTSSQRLNKIRWPSRTWVLHSKLNSKLHSRIRHFYLSYSHQ